MSQEDYVKHCTAFALTHCADDLAYFEEEYPYGEKGLRERLRNVVEHDFARVTYTEAVHILQSEIAENKVVFEKYPNWGDDLGSEHERYLTEKVREGRGGRGGKGWVNLIALPWITC